jgi:SAM-dependent methyltransferase
VIDLGPQYLQGSFIKPGKEMPSQRKINCSLVRCNPQIDENGCGLLQMEHSVPPEILYAAYWYRSGTNATMRNHLKGIVDEVTGILRSANKNKLETACNVLDIGCNDGTMLSYYPAQFNKFGCDPSDVAQEVKVAKVVQDIFPSAELDSIMGNNKMDVISSIAMFYDLENPVEFVKHIKDLLSPEGIWVFEMSYMPRMLELDSYDTICHEHLEYYSLAVLEKIASLAGMKIFKIAFNEINGGSIRCFATHKESSLYYSKQQHQFMNDVRQKEFDLELDTDKPYVAFQYRIEKVKNDLHELLVNFKKEGKRVHIYGASTKGNTILQWCNINNMLVDYASERNPDKYGASTLGTNIPIISEEESRAMNPDYYLVLPWHFKQEFLEREKDALDKGTGFIFPIPVIDIYKK